MTHYTRNNIEMVERNQVGYRVHIKKGLSYSQVADKLGMTRSAVAAVIYKRRQKQRKTINVSI